LLLKNENDEKCVKVKKLDDRDRRSRANADCEDVGMIPRDYLRGQI